MIDSIADSLKDVEFKKGVSLADHTSFGIGGKAALFVEVDDESTFSRILKTSNELGIDTLVLGGGTNLLISDHGFEGLAIKLGFEEVQIETDTLKAKVGAGVSTSILVNTLIDMGLEGLEFAAGLPGTVGGAIAGNAGCFGHTLSDYLCSATVIERDGTVRTISDMNWFGFDYRHSALSKEGRVITSAVFELKRGVKADLKEKAEGYLDTRIRKHPPKGMRTAGSYFKNLPPLKPGGRRRAAGALLDQAGAHGLSVGDAAVFERHANIIVNRGAATARDVLELASKMKGLVKERFGVVLEEEVRFIGKRPNGL